MSSILATREKLIQAAQDELVAGNGHLEMQAVAKRAQVSVGLAYHHFVSKAGLIASVVDDFYSTLEATVFRETNWPATSWEEREKGRVGAYIGFHYAHPFAPLVIGPLSRASEVLDVETAFTNRQLEGGAQMLMAAQREGILEDSIDPHLTIALMIGGIRQALIFAMAREQLPAPEKLTDDVWQFMAAALRLKR